MFKVYPTAHELVIESAGRLWRPRVPFGWDHLFIQEDPAAFLEAMAESATPYTEDVRREAIAHAVLQSQEVWAAGVTYWRSRTARMTEAKDAGGGTFYDKVYSAERPELFFKASPHRVAASGTPVRIRRDSRWNVPEPELTLAINAHGRVFGYTIGNDMSSRDIEGENPLYLPQAKVYDRSAALGPCLLVSATPPSAETGISLEIMRAGATLFAGSTSVSQIKRTFPSLAEYLFRDQTFPHGCYLMTGTGIVPPDEFTLHHGDEIRITIEPIGTLVNTVA
jgi:2-dehydro-3-deoxy-D-arabinonate dehydratase